MHPLARWSLSVLSTGLALLLPCAPTAGQDTRQMADDLVRAIRAQQQADGSYGSYEETCRVLDLLGRCPRRYTDLDGPFVRRAAEIVQAHVQGGPHERAWLVLALASCITTERAALRDATRDALAADADALNDPVVLLALRSVRPGDEHFPQPAADADAGWRCLAAEDPASVEPPPVEDRSAWMRWARAARVRQLKPATWPALPEEVAQDRSLGALLDQLELVVLVHGLVRPPVMDETPRPPQVNSPLPLPEALAAALDYLGQHQDGGTFGLGLPGWSGPEPGITALCLSAAIYACDALDQPRPAWIDQGLDALLAYQRDDGAILDYGLPVYTTSVAIGALLDGGRPDDRPAVERAREFLVSMQADEDLGYDSVDDPLYGGVGYGGDERPDLSNTQMALEAAWRAGVPSDSAFMRKALVFLEANQNLGEVAPREWPRPGGGKLVSGKDGGATYMPGNSPAGEDAVGPGVYTARSYGSMTYALTKSYLFCGLDLDDPRVDAALDWLTAHYTLEQNPGFADPKQAHDGLYYYYLALARTLRLVPDERMVDSQGARIDWRADLTKKLLATQRIDGSWFNAQAARWFEGAPTLGTAYAVLALASAGQSLDR